MNTCYFCYFTETKYCPICKKWLCDECRKHYWERTKAAAKEKVKIIKKLITRRE